MLAVAGKIGYISQTTVKVNLRNVRKQSWFSKQGAEDRTSGIKRNR
jgi:hypothetical protein